MTGGPTPGIMHADAPGDVVAAQPSESDGILEPCQTKARRMLATKHRCRVPGCLATLSLYYNWRYRICMEHRKASAVLLDAVNQRFCQLCGKFQPVSEFSGES
jgi:hypothetical protein